MKISILLFLFFVIVAPGLSFAITDLDSAIRLPNVTFEEAEKDYLLRLKNERPDAYLEQDSSAHGSAVPYDKLDFSKVPKWEDDDVEKVFAKIRDERFLAEDTRPDFKRRISWLYPHDGCFARAAMAGQKLDTWKVIRPAKLFIFGSLNVKTPNAVAGSVSWWYHVVPLVVDEDGEYLVLDPAINPKKPMLVKDWVLTMISDVKNVKLSVCNAFSYVPSSSCLEANAKTEEPSATSQKYYLSQEWQNLVSLKRSPEKELGDFPPWLSGDLLISFLQ